MLLFPSGVFGVQAVGEECHGRDKQGKVVSLGGGLGQTYI